MVNKSCKYDWSHNPKLGPGLERLEWKGRSANSTTIGRTDMLALVIDTHNHTDIHTCTWIQQAYTSIRASCSRFGMERFSGIACSEERGVSITTILESVHSWHNRCMDIRQSASLSVHRSLWTTYTMKLANFCTELWVFVISEHSFPTW